MRLFRDLHSVWIGVKYVVTHGSDIVADRLDQLVKDIHSPRDYEWLPDQGMTQFECQLDGKPWPCDEWVRASEAIDSRKDRR